jgi:hypothetical protein
MNIVYYGACWPTNIGNAFIDYGSLYMIRTAAPFAETHFASELPRWLFYVNRAVMDRSLDLADLMDVDYVVVSGMNLCDEFLAVEGPILERMAQRNIKIIFNGCGGMRYDSAETRSVRFFFERIKPHGFVSRDEVSYEKYKDCFPRSHNGIDCAFFLSESFKPASLHLRDYVIFNFDSMPEPAIEIGNRKVIRTSHSCTAYVPERRSHRLAPFKRTPRIRKTDILMSDIPDDYLNLYANASVVYTDRVHASIATLAFGNGVRLYSTTPRAYLFEKVGAGDIRHSIVKLNRDLIQSEKEQHLSFLRRLFED